MGHPVYSAEEAVNEVRATMAFEEFDGRGCPDAVRL